MKHALMFCVISLSLLFRADAAEQCPAPPPDDTDKVCRPTKEEVDAFQPKGGLAWMLEFAEYKALAEAAFAAAGNRLEEIASERKADDPPWVVAIDADDTILNNMQFQLEGAKCGVGFARTRWKRWIDRREAGAVPGAAGFLARVAVLGGKVAIITNRSDKNMEATADNMRKLGINTDPERVCFLGRPSPVETPPYGNDKDVRRAELRAGTAAACWRNQCAAVKESWAQPHEIVMYIGDNVQDFPGLIQDAAAAHPEIVVEHLGRDWFLTPNAEYGSWETKTPPDWIKEIVREPGDDWANLSGLAADPKDPNTLYAVADKAVKPARIVTIDVCGPPPSVIDTIRLDEKSCGNNLDLEGIAIGKDGHFWVVSEGEQKAKNPDERRKNLLIEVSEKGKCSPAVTLPPAVQDMFETRGFEGVTTDEDGKLYMAIQSPLKGDSAVGERMTRIAKYDPDAKEPWSYYYFELAKPDAGVDVGLNELLYLGGRKFAVIERDNEEGSAAMIKRIHTFRLPPDDGSKVLKKDSSIDLISYFRRAGVPVAEQIEGLAITPDGRVYVVTDSDENKKTLLLYLGDAKDLKLTP